MSKQFYFISGLPRSGSTLLSALLNQNPKFYAGPMSPIVRIVDTLLQAINNLTECKAYPKPKELGLYVKDIFNYYYKDVEQEIVFDKHRYWNCYINKIEILFNIKPKIICTVRDIDEIYTSLTNLLPNLSNVLMTENDRVLRLPYDYLYKAFKENRNNIHIVEYKDLVNDPKQVMKDIYKFLNQDYYKHDFNNIEHKYKENDLVDEHPLLHTIRSSISKSQTKPSLETISRFKGMEFWK